MNTTRATTTTSTPLPSTPAALLALPGGGAGRAPARHQVAQLHDHWTQIVAEHPSEDRRVWAVLVDDDGPMPIGPCITDLPDIPDGHRSQVLVQALADAITDPGEGVSFLLARPGHAGAGSDEAWLAHLEVLASIHEVPLRAMFIATDEGLELASSWELHRAA